MNNLRSIRNPLWEKSRYYHEDRLEKYIKNDTITDAYIVLRRREYLRANSIGGYEAYLSTQSDTWFDGNTPDEAVEKLQKHLIKEGVDVETVNNLVVVRK